jgi:hypothetical protein
LANYLYLCSGKTNSNQMQQ